MKRFNWLVLAFGTMAFASVAFVGCGDNESDQVACEEDTDCEQGEICVNGSCAQVCVIADDCANPDHGCSGACPEASQPICFMECTSSEDCAEGEYCNTEFCNGLFGRCELPPSDRCATNDDCADGEFCNVVDGTCEAFCTEQSDCAEGFLCNVASGLCIAAGAECIDDDGCGDGQVCVSEVCVDEGDNSCTETADCLDQGDAYCGNVGGENQCVSISCGSAFNSCSRCVLGANNGSRDENGPVIFFAEQIKLGAGFCEPESANCGEGAKLYCEFSFHFFDPDGDFTPANNNLFVVSGKGTTSTTFNVGTIGSGIGKFGACFPTGANTPGTAIFVRDAANNDSNTLCTLGQR